MHFVAADELIKRIYIIMGLVLVSFWTVSNNSQQFYIVS